MKIDKLKVDKHFHLDRNGIHCKGQSRRYRNNWGPETFHGSNGLPRFFAVCDWNIFEWKFGLIQQLKLSTLIPAGSAVQHPSISYNLCGQRRPGRTVARPDSMGSSFAAQAGLCCGNHSRLLPRVPGLRLGCRMIIAPAPRGPAGAARARASHWNGKWCTMPSHCATVNPSLTDLPGPGCSRATGQAGLKFKFTGKPEPASHSRSPCPGGGSVRPRLVRSVPGQAG
jgi:hypothetical protein